MGRFQGLRTPFRPTGGVIGYLPPDRQSTRRYLADILIRIVNGHPQARIDDLLPWAYATENLKAVA